MVINTWEEFLAMLKARGGSTDMATSKTGRYPWLFHFCRGESAKLSEVSIYANTASGLITSPARNWSTREAIQTDYRTLREHGGFFNDTVQACNGEHE